jgi:hypothetical protein
MAAPVSVAPAGPLVPNGPAPRRCTSCKTYKLCSQLESVAVSLACSTILLIALRFLGPQCVRPPVEYRTRSTGFILPGRRGIEQEARTWWVDDSPNIVLSLKWPG